MPRGRHAYVKFYPSDWLGGTARLPRELHSMYFDVCLHNWDRAEAMTLAEQAIVFADVPDWKDKVETLIQMGKLRRNKGRAVFSDRAMIEARSASDQYAISVASGRDGAAKRWGNKEKKDRVPNREPVANQNQNQNHKEKETIVSKKPNGKATVWAGGDTVPDEYVQWAMANMGWARGSAVREGHRFIDHALANHRVQADWLASWRNWCRSPLQRTEPMKEPIFNI